MTGQQYSGMELKQEREDLPYTFEEAYRILKEEGPATIASVLGTVFTVDAYATALAGKEKKQVIRVNPRDGFRYIRYAYIHPDCWGKNQTCQGVRVGEIYRGPSSIYSWLDKKSIAAGVEP